MLLYIHVPFCKTKCPYCSFHSEAIQDMDADYIITAFQAEGSSDWRKPAFSTSPSAGTMKKQEWLDGVLSELDVRGKELKKPSIRTIFFGGGTPSLMEPKVIETIMKQIRKRFKVEHKAEISLEGNPESLNSKNKIKDYLSTGINRLSIGAQALDDSFLQTLGRGHTVNDVFNAVYSARTANCRNINIDMIWGLPFQRVPNWIHQVGELMKLKPDHISLYGLTIEANTPFEIAVQQEKILLPSEQELNTMYLRGSELLQESGYLQYEISNYSKMGFHCRHNLGYWEGEEYLGIGPSATSTIAGQRWTNSPDIDAWIKGVEYPQYEPEHEILSLQDRVVELIMLRLRTTRGMRVKAFSDLTGRDFLKDHKQLIQALHTNGLIRIINGYVRLTRSGFLVSNSIFTHLFENTKKNLALGVDEEFLQRKELKQEKKQKKYMELHKSSLIK